MELIDQQKTVLQDSKQRLEKLTSHRDVWLEKVNELNTEISQIKMLIAITEYAIADEETKRKNTV